MKFTLWAGSRQIAVDDQLVTQYNSIHEMPLRDKDVEMLLFTTGIRKDTELDDAALRSRANALIAEDITVNAQLSDPAIQAKIFNMLEEDVE